MTLACVEAVNAAKAALVVLHDEHLPSWEHKERRLAFIAAHEAVYDALERALHEAVTPSALGCVINPADEHGTGLREGLWPGPGHE